MSELRADVGKHGSAQHEHLARMLRHSLAMRLLTTLWFALAFLASHLPLFAIAVPCAVAGNQNVPRRCLYFAHHLFRWLLTPFISVTYVNGMTLYYWPLTSRTKSSG